MPVVACTCLSQGSHARTAICDSYRDGMDSVIARLGTALFWVTLLPIIHVALKGE